MYMPRLRARQHEIFAVINCAELLRSSACVIPILEPVGVPDALLARRIAEISSRGVTCDLVLNPSVGSLRQGDAWRELGDFYFKNGLIGEHGIAVLSNGGTDHAAISTWLNGKRQSGASFTVDVVHEPGLSLSLRGSTYRDVRWNVAEDRTVPGAYGLPLGGRPVVWESDPFPALVRNREYANRSESIFSSRTASYRSAGYVGLSDFLTLGRAFEPGGGPAYAVAIHLTYEVNGVVRLNHFCSDSNSTRDDPGGKFLEALDKLIAFLDARTILPNIATEAFRELHRRQHFPGLGKVKELSLMNHILVMKNATC